MSLLILFRRLGNWRKKKIKIIIQAVFLTADVTSLFFWFKSFHGLSIWKLKVLLKVKDTYLNSLSESVLSSISFKNSRIWHIKIMAHFTLSKLHKLQIKYCPFYIKIKYKRTSAPTLILMTFNLRVFALFMDGERFTWIQIATRWG